jgi:hypothetical protein
MIAQLVVEQLPEQTRWQVGHLRFAICHLLALPLEKRRSVVVHPGFDRHWDFHRHYLF